MTSSKDIPILASNNRGTMYVSCHGPWEMSSKAKRPCPSEGRGGGSPRVRMEGAPFLLSEKKVLDGNKNSNLTNQLYSLPPSIIKSSPKRAK